VTSAAQTTITLSDDDIAVLCELLTEARAYRRELPRRSNRLDWLPEGRANLRLRGQSVRERRSTWLSSEAVPAKQLSRLARPGGNAGHRTPP
jgi:hypothetical protein